MVNAMVAAPAVRGGVVYDAQGEALARAGYVPPPLPMDVLYLQRKLGGLVLLAGRLKARVPLQALLAPARRHDDLVDDGHSRLAGGRIGCGRIAGAGVERGTHREQQGCRAGRGMAGSGGRRCRSQLFHRQRRNCGICPDGGA